MKTVDQEDKWEDSVEDIGSFNPHGKNDSVTGNVSYNASEMDIEDKEEEDEVANKNNNNEQEEIEEDTPTVNTENLSKNLVPEVHQTPKTILRNSLNTEEEVRNISFVTPTKTNNPYKKTNRKERKKGNDINTRTM